MTPALHPSVGLFWRVPKEDGSYQLIYVTTELDQAEDYGDCLTDGRGHYQVWEGWRQLSPRILKLLGVPLTIKRWGYERWPRGRVVYEVSQDRFVILADRSLHHPTIVSAIMTAFAIENDTIMLQTDLHYRTRNSGV